MIGVDDDNDGDSLIGVIASAAEVLELVFDSKKLRFMGDWLMIVISRSFLGKDCAAAAVASNPPAPAAFGKVGAAGEAASALVAVVVVAAAGETAVELAAAEAGR